MLKSAGTRASLVAPCASSSVLLVGVVAAVAARGAKAAPTEVLSSLWTLSTDNLTEQQQVEQLQLLVVATTVLFLSIALLRYIWFQRTLSQRLGMPVMHRPPQGRSWPWLGQALTMLKYQFLCWIT